MSRDLHRLKGKEILKAEEVHKESLIDDMIPRETVLAVLLRKSKSYDKK